MPLAVIGLWDAVTPTITVAPINHAVVWYPQQHRHPPDLAQPRLARCRHNLRHFQGCRRDRGLNK